MKFSIASLFAGSTLTIAPLVSYGYQLHVFESVAKTVLVTNGSANLPEAPTLLYAVSCIVGLALIALGYKIELHAVRATSQTPA
ncbi:hypothetical protein [Undibacterium sp. Di24W]|uniref:hypothetical protein n=1 Tax=Undibacterium sp. Di24W TaxID=3413033 RepID=UPI003BEF944B